MYASGLHTAARVRKALASWRGSAIDEASTARRSSVRPAPALPGPLRKLKKEFWPGSGLSRRGREPPSGDAFAVSWARRSFASSELARLVGAPTATDEPGRELSFPAAWRWARCGLPGTTLKPPSPFLPPVQLSPEPPPDPGRERPGARFDCVF